MVLRDLVNKIRKYIKEGCNEGLFESVRKGVNYLNIDFNNILKFDIEIADNLLEKPEDILSVLNGVIKDESITECEKFHVRIKNLPKTQRIHIREIRVKHLNKFISVEGVVFSRTNVRPHAGEIRFECPSCGNVITILQLDKEEKNPSMCGCGRKGRFKILSKELYDAMALSLEEDVAELGEDTVPKKINVILKYDLTNTKNEQITVPGKNVRINGILKEVQLATKTGKSNQYDLVIEANSIEPLEETITKFKFTPDEIKEFDDFSKDECLFSKLIGSVAPHINGHKEVKLAMLLFIVKSVFKESKENKIQIRDFFHVPVDWRSRNCKIRIRKRDFESFS